MKENDARQKLDPQEKLKSTGNSKYVANQKSVFFQQLKKKHETV